MTIRSIMTFLSFIYRSEPKKTSITDHSITNHSFMEPTEFFVSDNSYCDFTCLYPSTKSFQKISKTKSVYSHCKSYFHYLSKYKFTDLTIEVGEKPNIERFNAHTEILSNSTPYFKCALSPSWAKFENGKMIFKKPNIAPKVFLIVLNGKVLWKQHAEKDIFDFLVATEELLIDDILDEGQCHLIEERYKWILCNLSLVTFTSFRYNSFEIFQDYCIEKICENPRLLFRSIYFLKLDGSFWTKFLNQDKIQMEEFEIWHNLILWGIGQISETNRYFFSFSKKKLTNLKNILLSYIPLIRFTEFSVNQFYTFVWPFRDIIDINLRNEITDFQNNLKFQLKMLLEPRQPKLRFFKSKIITPLQEIQIIHKIPKIKQLTLAKIYCELNLLLRGTRDGFTSKEFHNLCDNKGPTIVIMKVRTSGEIIGGYNPVCWGYQLNPKSLFYVNSKRKYIFTNESFIFSFGPRKNCRNIKFSSVKKNHPAIKDDPQLGPCFGKQDIHMTDNFDKHESCTSQSSSFNNIMTEKRFSVIEYEVFQVVYKKSNENRWISFMNPKYFKNDKYIGPVY
ncbi:9690_t:CDS:2 [Cetraspora pellucida]|uniref:9690_t:CDS:1 n=1 Tax=Cetraspora pellucida TaxID=1433469 RepID=A0A9N8W3X5_9GLOM|nr:9690_t:CDS:2 [Cetraspora pellucida]